MKKVLILTLLLIGCWQPTDPVTGDNDPGTDNTEIEVAWIYYGNENVDNSMEGCFWIAGENAPNDLGFPSDGIGIGTGFFECSEDETETCMGDHMVSCINYGEKLYIRHNIELNYFAIEAETWYIYPHNYEILEYLYVTNQPSEYDSPDKPNKDMQ